MTTTRTRSSPSSSRLFLQPQLPQNSLGMMNLDDIPSGATMTAIAAAIKSVKLDLLLESTKTALTAGNNNPMEHLRKVLQAANDVAVLYAHGVPVWQRFGMTMAPSFVFAIVMYGLSFPPSDYRDDMEPYPPGRYDPVQAREYYLKHPQLIARRVAELLRLSQKFLWHLVCDKFVFKSEEKNRPKRARELLELITHLGPTAIKVGQALSVRQDIIPDEYAAALATLQDQVPPFQADKAREILLNELGVERYNSLKGLGLDGFGRSGPVASASIGQVYRCFLNDKTEVAVKVQRPNVLSEIALDLYIAREYVAPIYAAVTGTSTDLQALADEWGRGFVVELDYKLEAAATKRFTEEMKARNLNAVCAPTVVENGYSTSKVLVTEWIDGTRIDQSDADDIPRLCSIALNAYLVMLLELKSLHCDPVRNVGSGQQPRCSGNRLLTDSVDILSYARFSCVASRQPAKDEGWEAMHIGFRDDARHRPESPVLASGVRGALDVGQLRRTPGRHGEDRFFESG